jgi:hypothetical protein
MTWCEGPAADLAALCTAGTLVAAEDRWLVDPSGSTRSVRTRMTDGPRR